MPDDDRQPWDQLEDESAKAYDAFCVYRDLGPRERSIARVAEELGRPSGYTRWLEEWSTRYDWVDRVEAWDAYLEEQRREEYEREMTTGLSHAGARVQKLKALHDRLEAELDQNLWVLDVKIGPEGEQVHIPQYNSRLVRDYLKTLGDLAKEVGGRKQKVDVTSQGQALSGGIDVQIDGAMPLVRRPGEEEDDE